MFKGSFRQHTLRVTLFTVVAALVLSILPFGALHPKPAYADSIFFGDLEGPVYAEFGPNTTINITGNISFINGCAAGGIDDFIYPWSDIYVVPDGQVSGSGRVRLTDVSGIPNTVEGVSGGLFMDEAIGFTAPAGSIGTGAYDIVIDNCQDGYFDATQDFILGVGNAVAFRVIIPANVPNLPNSINAVKNVAQQSYVSWANAHDGLLLMFKLLELYDTIGQLTDPGDVLMAQFYGFMQELTGVDPQAAVLIHMFNIAGHYRGLAADPPDANYKVLPEIGPRTPATSASTDAAIQAAFGVGNAADDEGVLVEAFIHAVERYQGADAAGDGEWALIHARKIREYASLLAARNAATNGYLTALRGAIQAHPADLDGMASRLEASRSRVAASGFTADEIRELRNRGMTQSQIDQLRANLSAKSYASFTRASLIAQIDSLIASNQSGVGEFQTLANDMVTIIGQLEADPNTIQNHPKANAGGPYSGAAGAPIAFNGSGSNDPNGDPISYAWDLDGDSQFDDGIGANPSFTYSRELSTTIGLKVTDSSGRADIAYAALNVTNSNRRPTISGFLPTARDLEVIMGSSQVFSIVASDPDAGDTVAVRWRVDGVNAATGNTFTYSPIPPDLGIHVIEAIATDSSPSASSAAIDWLVTALAPDADGDGWRANSDCNDNNANVNPGKTEILGNGLDDDCNVATSDLDPAPTANFTYSPSVGIAGQPMQFTDTSTDPDDAIVTWNWRFGDGATSASQNPTHTFAVNGFFDVFFEVADAQGNRGSITKTVKVTQPPTTTFTYSPTLPFRGGLVEFTDTSLDADGSVVAWSWQFGDGTGSTLRNPTHIFASTGTFNVTLFATDNDGAVGSSSQILDVADFPPGPVDNPPAVTLGIAAGPRVGSGQSVSIMMTTTDDIGLASVSYSARQATTPTETLVASETRLKTGTSSVDGFAFVVPRGLDPSLPLVIQGRATDILGQATETAPISLEVDAEPTLAVPASPVQSSEGTSLAFQVISADPEGSAPSLSASTLPSGATFVDGGNGAGAFAWTPSYSASRNSPYSLIFRASDGVNLAVERTVIIQVANVEVPPALAPISPTITALTGSPLSFVVNASDADGTAPSLAASPLPTGATFTDNGNGNGGFSWTPTALQTGVYNVNFSAADGTTTVFQPVRIEVYNVNFLDDFFTTMDPNWTWTDPLNDATQTLTARLGYLRMTARPGNGLWPTRDFNAPRLLRNADGDFSASTRLELGTSPSFQGAGIVVWQDTANFLRFERNDQLLAMWAMVGGVDRSLAAIPVSATSLELRVERNGSQFSAWWRASGETAWRYFGTVSANFGSPVAVGLSLINSWDTPTALVDYDYFQLQAPPIALVGANDELDSPTLDRTRWRWVHEDPTHWSLATSPGNLRIVTQEKDTWQYRNSAPVLAQRAPAGDFEVITRVTFTPTINYEQAGLLLYGNDDNYLRLMYGFFGGVRRISFAREVGGSYVDERNLDAPVGNTFFLKIVRTGQTYGGYYSQGGSSWTLVWEYADTGIRPNEIAISAFGAGSWQEKPADFDYFHVLALAPAPPPPTPTPGAPRALFNPTGSEQNVALFEAGALPVAVSSYYNSNHTPDWMLNFDAGEWNPWATTGTSNQWLKIRLAGGGPHLIDRVLVMPRRDYADQRVKEFSIDISATTADDAAFTAVMSAIAANDSNLQEFVLPQPALAKYVRYRPLSNYGDPSSISTQQFKVMSGQLGGRTVNFQDLSTDPGNNIVSWRWDFGDGTTSTERSPSHTFPGTGSYSVTLTVTNGAGLSDSVTLGQRVIAKPSASFTVSPAVPNEGQATTFSDTSTNPDDGTITRHNWYWQDNSPTVAGSQVQHTFSDNQTYPVTLEVLNNLGFVGHATQVIRPVNVPPYVSAGPDQTVKWGPSTWIGSSVYDPGSGDNATLAVRWEWGDGTVSNSTGTAGVQYHNYALPGVYSVTVSAQDKDDAAASDQAKIILYDDSIAPTTSIQLDGNQLPDSWFSTDVRVTLTAIDNPGGSGVEKIEYNLDAGGWATYGGPFVISSHGSHPVWVRSTDRVNNVENIVKTFVKVDKTPLVDRITAGQAGLDWLTPQAVSWGQNNYCEGCHVQGVSLYGLAVSTATGYNVNRSSADYLASFIASTQQSSGVIGRYVGSVCCGEDNALSAYAGVGLAAYDRYVGTSKSQNLVRLADWVLGRQQSNGRWIQDAWPPNPGEPPVLQGDISVTGSFIQVLAQAKQRVDTATAAAYQNAIDRAVTWVRGQTPSTTQDHTYAIIGLKAAGLPNDDAKVVAVRDRLLSSTMSDGAWVERTGLPGTSPYATGQALYALCQAGVRADEPRVAAGLNWLIHSQRNDTLNGQPVVNGPWDQGITGIHTDAASSRVSRFLPTIWPVVALGCFGQLGVQVGGSPERQLLGAGQPLSQTIRYTIYVTNSGAVADSYALAVSGGQPGWSATLDRTTLALDPQQSGTALLTVDAPANLPPSLPVYYAVVATSQSSAAVSARTSLLAFTNPPPPTTGNATRTTLTAGNGVNASVVDTIRLAARVTDATNNQTIAGPGKGTVTFFVAGVVVGSDSDANGDGTFEINWRPGWPWSALGAQDLRAVYSGIDLAAPATDLLSSYDAGTITLIRPANNAPVANAGGPYGIRGGASLTVDASASNDPDLPFGDVLSYAWDMDNDGVFDDASGVSAAIPWSTLQTFNLAYPANPQTGQPSNPIAVKVTDFQGLSSIASTTLSVTVANTPPALAPIADRVVDELAALTLPLVATDPEAPPQALAFTLEPGAPAGASIDPSAGLFSWIPSEAQGPGVYQVTVRVTDNGTPILSDTKTFSVTVNEVNQAPTLGIIALSSETVDEETAVTFTARGSDTDAPANSLTYSLVEAPAGATIDPCTGAFSWTPSEAQGPGSYTFKVRVTDNGSPAQFAEQTIALTVNEVNRAPVLAAIADRTVDELTPVALTALASDPDLPANTLTYSLVSAPEGAAIDPISRAFTWTPTEEQGPRVYAISVRVTDNGSPSLWAEQSFRVTVNEVNRPPVLAPIGKKAVAWGDALAFTAAASDADLPANQLTMGLDGGAPAGASIDPSTGAFQWTPTAAQIGTHSITVRVTDNGQPALSAAETIVVTVGRRPTAVVYNGASATQFSDLATMSAQLNDAGGGTRQGEALGGKAIGFTIGAQSAAGTTGANGVAGAGVVLDQAAAAAAVISSFAGDDLYLPSSDSDPFAIAKESATLEYTGNSLVATGSASASSTAQVNLAAIVREEPDGTLGGKLGLTQVRFTVYRFTDSAMTSPVTSCAAPVSAGAAGTGTAGCQVPLGADNYMVKVELVPNAYYAAPVETPAVTVVEPGTGFTTGGGWLTEPSVGTRSNYGFTVKYLKNGNVQGKSLYIYRVRTDIGYGPREYNWIVKSNAMAGLAQQCTTTNPAVCTATFSGKSNITAVDRETGVAYSLGGNYQFQVDVTDRAEPGSTPGAGPDSYALRVWNDSGTYYALGTYAGTSNTAQVAIGGGNIQVHVR